MLNPTTGALEIPPDAGAEIEKELLRELRRIEFRIISIFRSSISRSSASNAGTAPCMFLAIYAASSARIVSVLIALLASCRIHAFPASERGRVHHFGKILRAPPSVWSRGIYRGPAS